MENLIGADTRKQLQIGEISSNGNTYIEGKNYTSTGAVTSGNTVKINASENIKYKCTKN